MPTATVLSNPARRALNRLSKIVNNLNKTGIPAQADSQKPLIFSN